MKKERRKLTPTSSTALPWILAIIIIIIVIGGAIFVGNFLYKPSSLSSSSSSSCPLNSYEINFHLKDGEEKQYPLQGYGNYFEISVTSTGDRMNVKIIIDGYTYLEENNVYEVHQGFQLSSDYHFIHVYFKNPCGWICWGSPINVNGYIRFGCK